MIDSNLFPKVLIKNIDIDYETSKEYQLTNPHVNDLELIERRTHSYGKASNQLRNSSITSEENLVIEVELAFKINETDSIFETFFDKDFVNKYFRISAFLSSDLENTKRILEKFNKLPVSHFEEMAQQGIINYASTSMSHIDFEATKNEDIEDNIIRLSFKFSDINPKYLSLMAFSYFDIKEIERDFNIDLSSNEHLRAASSTLAVENIFVNGKLVSEAYIFFDNNGRQWNGPVEVVKNKFYKYGTDDELIGEIVDNTVVSDYRPIKEFEQDFSEFNNLYNELSEKFDTISVHNRTRGFKPQYFTDLFLTQDENANARFGFGVNYKNILMEEGKFGFLFFNEDRFKNAMVYEKSPIFDMTIYRQRIEKVMRDNSLNTLVNDISYFNEERNLFIVANNSEKKYKKFNKKEFYSINNTSQDLIGIVREIDTSFEDVRMFTVSDENLNKVTDGLYTYKVDISIKDGTIEFVNDLYDQIKQFESFVRLYKCDAEAFGNYDIRTGRITDKFITELENKNIDWKDKIFYFIMNLSFIVPNLKPNLYKTLGTILDPKTTTLYGLNILIKLVEKFVWLLEREFVSNTLVRNYGSQTKFADAVRKNYADYGIIKVSKEFEVPVVDSNLIKHKGMEFIETLDENLNISYDNFDGLATISLSKFKERADNETRKFFNNSSVPIYLKTENKTYLDNDSTDKNKYGFFTATKLKYDVKSVEYLTKVSSFNVEKTTNLEIMLKNDPSQNKNQFLKNSGVHRMEEKDSDQKTTDWKRVFGQETFAGRDTSVSSKTIDSGPSNFGSFGNAFSLLKKNKGVTQTKKSSNVVPKHRKAAKGSSYDVKNTSNVLDDSGMNAKSIEELPNQHKSLFMASIGHPSVNANIFVSPDELKIKDSDGDKEASFVLNYQNLVKLEVLIGFDALDGKVFVKKPKWVQLTSEILEEYKGRELVCRFRRYDSPFFDRKSKQIFNELPIYNDFFIINMEKSEPPVDSILDFKNRAQNRKVVKSIDTNSGIFNKNA